MVQPIIRLVDLHKRYQQGSVEVHALRGLNIDIMPGEYVCVMGPSGCGKSTLLNLLGCLDQPTSGQYILGGEDVAQLDDDKLSSVRGKRLGFIFQSYNLIPQLTVLENIELPLFYQGVSTEISHPLALELAKKVGLEGRTHHRPIELSGGQQQRVAIARALANNPLVILADEATGNLDSKTGDEILALFDQLNRAGTTLIFVTHDERVAKLGTRNLRLRDGSVEVDETLREIPSLSKDPNVKTPFTGLGLPPRH